MALVRRFAAFWYDFIVGEDWVVAPGVAVLLALSAALAQSDFESLTWALLPLGVVPVLALSLWRGTRTR